MIRLQGFEPERTTRTGERVHTDTDTDEPTEIRRKLLVEKASKPDQPDTHPYQTRLGIGQTVPTSDEIVDEIVRALVGRRPGKQCSGGD